MVKKYEMNKDIYDKFDAYLDDIMSNDAIGHYDYDYNGELYHEMILGAMIMHNNIESSNYNDNNVLLIASVGTVIGFIALLWYLVCRRNKEFEYIAIETQ